MNASQYCVRGADYLDLLYQYFITENIQLRWGGAVKRGVICVGFSESTLLSGRTGQSTDAVSRRRQTLSLMNELVSL